MNSSASSAASRGDATAPRPRRSQPRTSARGFSLKCTRREPRQRREVISQMSIKELLESWREHAAAPRTARRPGPCACRWMMPRASRRWRKCFPGVRPEQLVTELLGKALKELVAAMPYVAGKRVISTDEQGDPVYEDVGPTPRFMALARRTTRRSRAGASRSARCAGTPETPGAQEAAPQARTLRRGLMPSFDAVSELNAHEVANAIDQANRELSQRFRLQGHRRTLRARRSSRSRCTRRWTFSSSRCWRSSSCASPSAASTWCAWR